MRNNNNTDTNTNTSTNNTTVIQTILTFILTILADNASTDAILGFFEGDALVNACHRPLGSPFWTCFCHLVHLYGRGWPKCGTTSPLGCDSGRVAARNSSATRPQLGRNSAQLGRVAPGLRVALELRPSCAELRAKRMRISRLSCAELRRVAPHIR